MQVEGNRAPDWGHCADEGPQLRSAAMAGARVNGTARSTPWASLPHIHTKTKTKTKKIEGCSSTDSIGLTLRLKIEVLQAR